MCRGVRLYQLLLLVFATRPLRGRNAGNGEMPSLGCSGLGSEARAAVWRAGRRRRAVDLRDVRVARGREDITVEMTSVALGIKLESSQTVGATGTVDTGAGLTHTTTTRWLLQESREGSLPG